MGSTPWLELGAELEGVLGHPRPFSQGSGWELGCAGDFCDPLNPQLWSMWSTESTPQPPIDSWGGASP